MAISRTCDGVTRRDFLRVGAIGASGLSLSAMLRGEAMGMVSSAASAKSAIYIHLGGGPSHVDTFDPKPDASDAIRGEFKPIATKTPGLVISEHLPKLAACSNLYTVIRGLSHSLAAHDLGARYMATGNRPLPSLEFPSYGSVVSKELKTPPDLPPFVAIPSAIQDAGYLGVAYSPLNTGEAPQMDKPFKVRGLAPRQNNLSPAEKREQLLRKLDTAFAGQEMGDPLLEGLDRFAHQAHDILASPRTREAFDIEKEPASLRTTFGKSAFGQSCLLAIRLLAAGTRFVTITFGGWDTHQRNFPTLKEKQLPELDQGLAGLLTTLADRGMLAHTAVFVTGEFGRTPKINKTAGRDHWPRAMTAVLAGGGFAGGRVIGASDKEAMGPAGKPVLPDNLAASLYHLLGVDHQKEYHTTSGRPVMIVREGQPMKELFA